jgi:hypothetical protein
VGSQLVLLFVGFALTTVVGGALGFWFQKRNADIQSLRDLQQAERSTALDLFEELSTMMDRRIYRMRRLCWQLQSEDRQRASVDDAMTAYREIVRDWNDRLNRNLAVTEIYFGRGIRDQLHAEIYTGFAQIGSQLEAAYRGDPKQSVRAEAALDTLADAVYELNVRMIRRVRDGRVGAFLPETGSQAARAVGTPIEPPTDVTLLDRDNGHPAGGALSQ